jgi:hypothetical protein
MLSGASVARVGAFPQSDMKPGCGKALIAPLKLLASVPVWRDN